MAEPLTLTIKVNPIRPDWSVNMDNSENSMSICGQIRINGKISTDPDDMVGVFCGNECIGVAHNSVDNVTGDSHVFLTVYGTALLRTVQPEKWSGRVFLVSATGP